MAAIRSRPGALFWFKSLISYFISFKVNALRRSCDSVGVAGFCSASWSWSLLCGEKLRKDVMRIFQVFLVAFYTLSRRCWIFAFWGVMLFWVFSSFFVGFQVDLSCLLRVETYFSKDSFHISWSFDLSLLFIRLYFLLLSGVWVLCQTDLALLVSATSFLIS